MLCLHICTNMMLPFSCLLNLELESIHCHFYIKVGPIKSSIQKKKNNKTGSDPAEACVFISALVCHLESRLLSHHCCSLWIHLGSFPVSFFSKYILKIHLLFLKLENKIISLIDIEVALNENRISSFQRICGFFPVIFVRLPVPCNSC